MNLIKGLIAVVAALALVLGFSLGHNARPTDADALAAKQRAYDVAAKRARVNAREDAFKVGLQEGMLRGARRGKAKGEAAAAAAEPTGATGSSSATGVADSGGSTAASGN